MAEAIYYHKGGITVTASRLVADDRTHILRHVASVRKRREKGDRVVWRAVGTRGAYAIAMMLGGGALGTPFSAFVVESVQAPHRQQACPPYTVVLLVLGMVLAGVGALRTRRAERWDYTVLELVHTGGGREDVRVDDPDVAEQVIAAVNRALAQVG